MFCTHPFFTATARGVLTEIREIRQTFPECGVTFRIEVKTPQECAAKPYASMLFHYYVSPKPEGGYEWRRVAQPIDSARRQLMQDPTALGRTMLKFMCCVVRLALTD